MATVTQTPEITQVDLEMVDPDYHVIAQNLVKANKRKVKNAPTQMDFAQAITQVQLNLITKGANNIVISLQDPEWFIFDSGFFDTDESSEIDPIDVNYPDGSRYWWRLTQVTPKADHTLQLTLLVREAVYLMHLIGPFKMDRAKATRAQFLEACSDRVHEGSGIEFYSKELDIKEPIGVATAISAAPSANAPVKQAKKTPALGASTAGLTIKGQPMSSQQAPYANQIIAQGHQYGASTLAVVAVMTEAIAESGMGQTAYMGWDGTNPTYGGLLAGSTANFASMGGRESSAVTIAEIESAFKGGRGFYTGGAMGLAAGGGDPLQIAMTNSGSGTQFLGQAGHQNYATEAAAIVQAGGGGGVGIPGPGGGATSSVTTIQAYFFEINPNELYWDGMTRLAQEVNWELFFDGNHLYYDSEMVLIRDRPKAHVHRDDPAVTDWTFTWDARHIATGMTLTMICQMFEFAPGDVFTLEKFGAASTGSTATPKLPGRWIVDTIQRNKTDIFSTFTLKQPDLAKQEPAPQISTTTSTAAGAAGGAAGPVTPSGNAGADKFLAEAIRISGQNLPYTWGGGHGSIGVGNPGFDCSGYVSACAAAAGWLSSPLDSTSFESWGQAGPGQLITIWCNSGHVYAEFKMPGTNIKRADTVPDGSPNGPHTRTGWPPPEGTGGFTPRHWPGS